MIQDCLKCGGRASRYKALGGYWRICHACGFNWTTNGNLAGEDTGGGYTDSSRPNYEFLIAKGCLFVASSKKIR